MNIFCTSESALVSALWLDDIRARKMILENAQMLSACVHHYARYIPGYRADLFYKLTHSNHPCSLWIKESIQNTAWLILHSHYLNILYKIYSEKDHKSHNTIEVIEIFLSNALDQGSLPEKFALSPMTPFANCTPFKHYLDTRSIHAKYQAYMIQKWEEDEKSPTWYNRSMPKFYLEFLQNKEKKHGRNFKTS